MKTRLLLLNHSDARRSLHGYEKAFQAILSLSPCTSSMRICVEETAEGTQVYGRDGSLKRAHGIPESAEGSDEEESFALELTPWEEWLGMEVDPVTLASYLSRRYHGGLPR